LKVRSAAFAHFLRLCSADGGFGSLNDGIEAFWVSYGNLAQHFAVKLNVGLFTAVDELAVSYASLTTGSAEAYNPEAAEIAFAAFSVDSCIDRGAHDGLFGQSVRTAGRSLIPFCSFEDSLFGVAPCSTFSNSWHISFSFLTDLTGLLAAADWRNKRLCEAWQDANPGREASRAPLPGEPNTFISSSHLFTQPGFDGFAQGTGDNG
jgi:hypothetical protein